MLFNQGYEKFLTLSESNGTTDGLSTDKGRFAIRYNLMQDKVIEWFIESNGTDENRYLQSIKVVDKPLEKAEDKDDYQSFKLPTEYFDYINLNVFADQGECKNIPLKTREVKLEITNTIYQDPMQSPSFKYVETFHTIAENNIQVYRTDFDITKTLLSYYRAPVQVALEDPEDPESPFAQGEFEFDQKLTNRIILATISLHELSSDDPKYQAFKQETISKF